MKIPTWLAVVIIAIFFAGAVWYVTRGGGATTSPEDIDKMIAATAIGKGSKGGMPSAKPAPKVEVPAGTRAAATAATPAPAPAK